MEHIDIGTVRNILKQRPEDMHKGQAGRVLIIAGQTGMAGAAVLSARGALYSGAGLVKVSAPENIFDIIQISVPEAMCINRDDIDLSAYDAIAIGPGLGVRDENVRLLRNVLTEYDGPVVIDADGLNCLCKDISLIAERKSPTVITPHPGEADRLLKAFGNEGYKAVGRDDAALQLAESTGAIVLLKGSKTIVTTGDKTCVNTTGNPGMATGGSGDVLTGMIVSFMAQGIAGEKADADRFMNATPLESVIAAVYLHGLAGDIAAENIGQYGMTSADIADAVSAAIKEVTGF